MKFLFILCFIFFFVSFKQFKEKIHLLERQLDEERKKTEDLQFSVDEATVNGEELNVSSKVLN